MLAASSTPRSRSGAAVRSPYRHARRTLVDGLGIEPGEELRELERAILRHERLLRLAPRRKRLVFGAAGVVAAPLAVTLALVLGGVSGSVRVGAREVGILDARSGRVLAAVPLGFPPTTVTSGAGGVWIGGGHGQLVRIDPERARVADTFAVGAFSIEGLVAGARDVWFAAIGGSASTIYRLDPRSGAVAPAFRIPDRSQLDRSAPEPLALAGDSLWASNGMTRLTRIDLRTRKLRTLLPDNGSGEVWASQDVVWSLNAQTDTLTRIDARPLQTVTVLTLAENDATPAALLFPIKLDARDGSVWIVEYGGRSLGRSTSGRTRWWLRSTSAIGRTPSRRGRASSGSRAATERCSGSIPVRTGSCGRCGSTRARGDSRSWVGASSSRLPSPCRTGDWGTERRRPCLVRPIAGSGLDRPARCLHTGSTLRQSPRSRTLFNRLTAPLGTASVILIVVVISILPF
jgi:streptogramin lyase